MAKRRSTFLDQARDPLAFYYEGTALAYDAYLQQEYELNCAARQDQWRDHYRNMRHAFGDCLVHLTEERGKKRKDMNIGIVGPGMRPVGRDFNSLLIDLYLREVNVIIVIDFSTRVVRSAINSLLAAGVPHHLLYGAHYDITDGLSTAYYEYIREALSGKVEHEEEFARVVRDKFDSFTIDELEERRARGFATGPGILQKPLEDFLQGGRNEPRGLKFSAGGEKLPLDMVAFQMILAGTGAAAEGLIWERLAEVMSAEGRVAKEPSPETKVERKELYTIIHQMITKYNTEVSRNILKKVLQDNAAARVLALTDVTTIHRKPPFGKMDRLNTDALACELSANRIMTTISSIPPWIWSDEPEHSHLVEAIICESAHETKRPSPTQFATPPSVPPTVVSSHGGKSPAENKPSA